MPAWTVSVKSSLPPTVPLVAFTVMVAVPVWPGAGVTVTVRFAPVPPKTTFPTGTRVVFDEPAVRIAGLPPWSVTTTGIGDVGVFSAVARSEMSEIGCCQTRTQSTTIFVRLVARLP
ncbi:MAG: hypothetical protein WKG06_20665 [Segetibacter sp.]